MKPQDLKDRSWECRNCGYWHWWDYVLGRPSDHNKWMNVTCEKWEPADNLLYLEWKYEQSSK